MRISLRFWGVIARVGLLGMVGLIVLATVNGYKIHRDLASAGEPAESVKNNHPGSFQPQWDDDQIVQLGSAGGPQMRWGDVKRLYGESPQISKSTAAWIAQNELLPEKPVRSVASQKDVLCCSGR